MSAAEPMETDGAAAEPGNKLDGRVAFVTGGTRGIGASICRSLASQGAELAAGFAGRQETAEAFAADFRSEFPAAQLSLHQGNVSVAEDCRRTVQEVIDQHGKLDILVNNAGITKDRTVLKMADEDWRHVIDVNLTGTFFMAQTALRHMVERGSGRIINVASIVGEIGNIGQANYAASKSGLFGLTKTLAREAAFHLARADKLTDDGLGITVNTVSPGAIATEMVGEIPEKVLADLKTRIPLGRLGQPDEVARVVHFLAADASAYITGQVWGINGGLDM
ncbi:MAG: 3-oxoacyl-ACP reductase FabG [Microlunatus sp.]|nr:3-oxoacyl-ACP reductase FabG [Microlunatus sp.]MDN5770811.1 3-oxoacyl-ACP reductase FabG [Microlunatus sp.]MDN5804682.1 3-oxoacyl-ACP reductase FabG [Microlunatus sp.]